MTYIENKDYSKVELFGVLFDKKNLQLLHHEILSRQKNIPQNLTCATWNCVDKQPPIWDRIDSDIRSSMVSRYTFII